LVAAWKNARATWTALHSEVGNWVTWFGTPTGDVGDFAVAVLTISFRIRFHGSTVAPPSSLWIILCGSAAAVFQAPTQSEVENVEREKLWRRAMFCFEINRRVWSSRTSCSRCNARRWSNCPCAPGLGWLLAQKTEPAAYLPRAFCTSGSFIYSFAML
jgi:hypothetical protein